MDTYKQVTPACILGCAALHISCALARSEHVVQQPQGREIICTAWRIDDLSVMNGLTLRKPGCWWEWVHKGARPPQAATIYSLSYSPLTPPHRGLHHRWHYFPTLETHIPLLETSNAPLFFLRPLGLCFPSLSCKSWGVSPKIHGFILKS